MGNWHLEVFKLALYVTFPVGMFYFYNQPRYFEDWVIQIKREMFPPDEKSNKKEFQALIQKVQNKQQANIIRQMQQEELAYNELKKSS